VELLASQEGLCSMELVMELRRAKELQNNQKENLLLGQ
jgi:hypothetical protein